MMYTMQQSLFAAAARLAPPWISLSRRVAPVGVSTSRQADATAWTGAAAGATAPRSTRPTHSVHGAPRIAPHARRSPLRVVRILESDQASASVGRILMSGRMADVCAELDRMVEREAACQARARTV